MKFTSIAGRIFTLLLPTVIVTILAFSAFSFYTSNARINAIIDERMQQSLRAADSEIKIELQKNIAVAEALARYGRTLDQAAFDHWQHEQYLAELIAANEHTFGGGVWYEPYAFDPSAYYFGTALYTDADGVAYYTRAYEEYADYLNEDWYVRAKNAQGHAVWSAVYYDPYAKDMMVTVAKAFYDGEGTCIGVGAAQMNIDSIRRIARQISIGGTGSGTISGAGSGTIGGTSSATLSGTSSATIGGTGRAFIVGPTGEFISFINEASSPEHDYKTLAELGAQLAGANEGSTAFTLDGEKLRIYYTEMPETAWTLAIFIEENEIRVSTVTEAVLMIMIPVAGLSLLMVGLLMIVRYLRRIIHKVNDIAEQAAQGDLSRHIAVTESDEFGYMERRINRMIENMYTMRRRSDELLAVAERREHLLHAAHCAATVLLASEDGAFESSLCEGMALMARCMDVDRVYIWRNEIIDGEMFYEAMYEWISEIGRTEIYPQVGNAYAYAEKVMAWDSIFQRRECVNGPLTALSEEERQRLMLYGVVSVLVIPIYLQDRFWGFISFDDCHMARYFTEDEVDILRSAGLMMASAVVRNETAAQVREADERLRLMLDTMPMGCTLFDRDRQVIDCNEAAVKLWGLQDKEDYQQRFFALMPEYQPDGRLSRTGAEQLINEAFAHGRAVSEWVHQSADGELIPTEAVLVRIRHGQQDIVAGYTRDLREYKKIIAEREHKNRLLQAVNQAAAILLAANMDEFDQDLWQCMRILAEPVDADRVYIWKNSIKDGKRYGAQLYEWSEGATPQQGKYFTQGLPYDETLPDWETVLSQGRSINGRVRFLTRNEQAMLTPQGILSILVVPIFLQDTFWGFIGFDDCHSERDFSADEETILRSGGLLIANALLRNEMNLQIRAAVEAAETASRAKSSFLSNMSHEIRTPINAITGMTLIGKRAAEAAQKNYALDKIEAASMHLLGVINDILDMSKIEANKFTLSEVPFNLEKILQRAVNVINFRVDEKRQHFAVYMDGNLPATLIGDDQRLTQIITNLLSNAVKFTPEEGYVRLDARLLHEENGLCTIEIAVSDTGIGIDPARIATLFESFEQAERSISRHYGGTGLGLAITKHITELMGGRIRVESAPETGSVFTVTVSLPRGTETDDEGGVDNRRGAEGKGRAGLAGLAGRTGLAGLSGIADNKRNPALSKAALQKLRILFVDDEPSICAYFEEIAGRFGFACDTVGSGTEALANIAGKGAYHLYFVDWRMPEMDGITLTRAIKSRDSERAVVIMVSAVEWSEIEQAARAAGVDRFLAKPLFPSAVMDCIQELMSVHPTAMLGDVPMAHVRMESAVVQGESVAMESTTMESAAMESTTMESAAMENAAMESTTMESATIESVPIDTKTIDTKTIDTKTIDTKTIDAKTIDTKTIDTKTIDTKTIDAKTIDPKTISPGQEAIPEVSFTGRRVLLVEDVEINREIIITLLAATGITIDCATNGLEAVRMFEDQPGRYDLIFMDVQMPEMDGLEATRRIRQSRQTDAMSVPIVAMTANVFKDDIIQCKTAGMNDHLGKPLDFMEVLAVMQRYL